MGWRLAPKLPSAKVKDGAQPRGGSGLRDSGSGRVDALSTDATLPVSVKAEAPAAACPGLPPLGGSDDSARLHSSGSLVDVLSLGSSSSMYGGTSDCSSSGAGDEAVPDCRGRYGIDYLRWVLGAGCNVKVVHACWVKQCWVLRRQWQGTSQPTWRVVVRECVRCLQAPADTAAPPARPASSLCSRTLRPHCACSHGACRHPVAAYCSLPGLFRHLVRLPGIKRFVVVARPTIDPSGLGMRSCCHRPLWPLLWRLLLRGSLPASAPGALTVGEVETSSPHRSPAHCPAAAPPACLASCTHLLTWLPARVPARIPPLQAGWRTTGMLCPRRCGGAPRCWRWLTSRGCLRMSWRGRAASTTGGCWLMPRPRAALEGRWPASA